MKYIIYIVITVLFSSFTFADALEEYEHQHEQINRLKGQLEQLELQSKIQEVQLSIKKVNQELSAKPAPPPSAANRQALIQFSPETANVLYILGSGNKRKVVFSFRGENYSIDSGGKFEGWSVQVKDKNVIFSKGSQKFQK